MRCLFYLQQLTQETEVNKDASDFTDSFLGNKNAGKVGLT